MSKIIVFMSVSLDGFVAAKGAGPGMGLGVGGESLHACMTETFRPDDPPNAAVLDELMATGAVITGRSTFEWPGRWGEDHHEGVPIFVLTHDRADRPDVGPVRYRSDLPAAVAEARAAAGDRDILVHGASSVQALHRLGLVDEYVISLVPIVLGSGKRLFAPEPEEGRLRLRSATEGDGVLHLRYAVIR